MTRALAALQSLVAEFDRLAVPYALGGSLASGVHGEPRSTHDFHLLAGIRHVHVEPLLHALRGHFYVDESSVREALARHAAFNVIHLGSGQKIDVFVSSGAGLDREQMERRIQATLDPTAPPLHVTSAELIVLRKLDWFRRGGESSARQLQDVASVLREQRSRLDEDYLARPPHASTWLRSSPAPDDSQNRHARTSVFPLASCSFSLFPRGYIDRDTAPKVKQPWVDTEGGSGCAKWNSCGRPKGTSGGPHRRHSPSRAARSSAAR